MSSSSESDHDATADRGIIALSKDAHLFLQAAVSRRFFSEQAATEMYTRCGKITGSPIANFADFMGHINRAIDPYGLSIKRAMDQADGKAWYAVVNTTADDVAKVATDFDAHQLTFFRKLVERIITAPKLAFCVSRADAFEVAQALKPPMLKTDAQALLGGLVLKGWLIRHEAHNIFALSTRALLELETYLVQTYEDELQSAECCMCKDLVFEGVKCPTRNCDTRLHSFCNRGRLSRWNQCPACQTPWPAESGIKIGIGALDARGTQDPSQGSTAVNGSNQAVQTQGSSTSTSSRRRETPAVGSSSATGGEGEERSDAAA